MYGGVIDTFRFRDVWESWGGNPLCTCEKLGWETAPASNTLVKVLYVYGGKDFNGAISENVRCAIYLEFKMAAITAVWSAP